MAVLGLLTAFALTAGFVPLVRLLAFRTGAVDRPNGRKIHAAPIPLLAPVIIATWPARSFITRCGSAARGP